MIKLTTVVLKQTNGLAAGAATSSLLSEIYLQYLEHTAIFDIPLYSPTHVTPPNISHPLFAQQERNIHDDPKEKQNETMIIKHIQQANKFSTSFNTEHNKQQNQKDKTNPTNKKWAKFTYIGKDICVITKFFKHTNIRIDFTRNSLGKLFTSRRDDQHTDIYRRNGLYQLTCNTCHK
jgi:hypothetical protein